VKFTLLRRIFGLLLCAISLLVLVWGFWPMPDQSRSLLIAQAEMLPPGLAANVTGDLPAIAQPHLLLLEWPAVIRSGDLASIRLEFSPVDQVSLPSQALPGTSAAYTILAEARLELPAISHIPMGDVSQGLLPGRPVMFIWDLRPNQSGEANGTVWLHLRFQPSDGRPDIRQVLSAQRIEIQVIDLLGLSGPWSRAVGSAGLVVGVVIALDGVWIWLWSRVERRMGG
jgi:hypothetical protein